MHSGQTDVFEKLELEFGFGWPVYIYASTHWGEPYDYAVGGKASLQGVLWEDKALALWVRAARADDREGRLYPLMQIKVMQC